MKNKKMKIVLSLVIAMSFIIPTGIMASEKGSDAGTEQSNAQSIIAVSNGNSQQPMAWANSEISISDVLSLADPIAEGCYDITVEVEKCNLNFPDMYDCSIKMFADIYKKGITDPTEIYCTDFEDEADVYNMWDSVDGDSGDPGNGAVDTFTRTTKRSNSPDHSFRNTIFEDEYMGNQEDYLKTKAIGFPSGLYESIVLTFSHWCEGELITDSGFGDMLQDYGFVDYSWDGSTWIGLPGAYWDTEGAWEDVTLTIPGAYSQNQVFVRFGWVSGPVIQNEGWYIDDVCISGSESLGWGERVYSDYTPHAINLIQNFTEYTFPSDYCFDEGEYSLRIWILTETTKCRTIHKQETPFWFNFTVGDVTDLSIVNTIAGGPIFDLGDDLVATATITNDGTIDAIDVPVTFSVQKQLTDDLIVDFVEGTFYDPATYDPYSDDAFLDGLWQAHDFGSYGGAWHIAEDVNFVSPNHAIMCADSTNHYPAGLQDNLCFDFEAAGINLVDHYTDLSFDLKCKINTKLNPADAVCGFVRVGSTWVTLSGTIGNIPDNTPGWVDLSFTDDVVYNYINNHGGTFMKMLEWLADAVTPGSTLEDITGIGFQVLGGAYGVDTVGSTAGIWSGVMLDNIRVESITSGGEVFTQTKIIPEIKAIAPGVTDNDEVVEFTWPDMPTGDYIEVKSVPSDETDDNEASSTFSVVTDIAEVDEEDVEHYDLTSGIDGLWHISGSNYDDYLWHGDEATGMYPADQNDVVLLKDDDDDVSFNMSGLTDFDIAFDDYQHIEGWPCDQVFLEVNPAVSQPGSHWYAYALYYGPGYPFISMITYQPYFALPNLGDSMGAVWIPQSYNVIPGDFVEMQTFAVLPGFTNDMGIRLRASSDPGWQARGILYDNIEVESGALYGPNPCKTMDDFELRQIVAGDWWFEDTMYGGWTCQDTLLGSIPANINNALVWDTAVPQATHATLHFTHDFVLLDGDVCYLEFSTDGGSSWIAPVAFTGTAAADYSIDMTSFIGDNVLIRWRVTTGDLGNSVYYSVKDMAITGQIDTVAPITTGTLSGTVNFGWYTSPVTFEATATDDVSGVAATYYKIDGGSTLTYTGPITISVNGEHYIEYWSVDNVGNEELHHVTDSFKIDTGSAPTVSITAPTPGIYLFGNQLLSTGSKAIMIGGFTVQASASDADSGVYKVQFLLDGDVFAEDTTSPYTGYCGVKHTGAGTIQVVAEDFAGNSASASLDVTYFKIL